MNDYLKSVQALLAKAASTEEEVIERIAAKLVQKIHNGGIIQLFGCGHSNLLAQEPYYRAGGLVPVTSINVEAVMLHNGGVLASANEKDEALAKKIANLTSFEKNDVLIVISTSGRNPVPIEAAQKARANSIYTIGLLSQNYSKESHPSKHSSGLRLEESVDDVINNHSPLGDSMLKLKNNDQPFGSSSSVIGTALLHALFTRVVQLMENGGITPPIFRSGNDDDSLSHNQQLVARYRDRIDF
ncbi:sugar isomerase domain-containing protein [Jeotgalibacillus proteolyticus]|uniref:sugar isomerase domain-containing protein n=1 Tax=Jeotgalibacillus proteolyticus TaxID=2082395 RepID=UPI003CF99930